ncbi:FRG domain-containing protein [Novosphingobium sp. KN65.2]|uniref:FRG domain-containing protein n=1 Tax=Novosphingobium sp. KN65.2 TaxID=1478134 RepID=UPI0005E308AF|nr:FRG domain-containing protein [Novosphingobium sp. KN65.2]CDO36928.1 FRG domain protein [Novosphingobium sp. KN65.2]
MTKFESHEPNSLTEILSIVESYQSVREVVWYRGVNNETHNLAPSIVRLPNSPKEEDIIKIEKEIYATFSQRSPPFIEKDFSNSWRSLFFMQHYGIPTRLLDWSESPFVALYFALSSVQRTQTGKPQKDVAMWLCDPIAWNRTALSHITYKGEILDENCEEIKAYSPGTEIDHRATKPVMIYGTHNSPRIVAQRGVFALFGKGLTPMEKIFEDEAFSKDILTKVIIKKEHIDGVLKSLFQKGITESVIFPDLQGLALEIRRKFGYK